MIYIVGSQLEGENLALLKEAMTTLGFPYRLSSFTTSIQYRREEILHEVQTCKPNLIMCLGTSALLLFAPDVEDKMAAARAYDGDYQDILVKCTYSPNFLVKRGGMRTKEFQTFQQDVKLAYEQATQTGGRESVEVQLYSPDEYLDFMAAYMNEPVVALDYEGSSLNPLEEKYRIAGIGLATDKKAGYLWFEDYATVGRELPAATMRKLARFMQVLDTKKPRVFNANYETLVTINVFNVRLRQCCDVMQNLRTLDITGGLKEIAASRLGIRGWTRDIDDWLENLKVVVGVFKPTARAAKKEYKILETDGIEAALQHVGAKELKNTPTQVEALRYILGKSEELYGPDEALNALERYLTYLNRINDWEVRYNHVPKEILGKYCGLDCHYTYQLEEKYRPELEARGLSDAAMYYNQQMQFGIEAELDGFAWDDAFAERLDAEYRVEAMNALRNFLLATPVSETLGLTNPVAQIEIKSATNIDTLKKYFNPNNNQAENTELLGKILLQPRVRLALVLREVNNLAQNTSEEETKKQYPTLFKLTQRYKQFVDNGTAHQFIDFCNQTLRKAKEANVLTDDERGILIRYTRYALPDASAETIEMLANAASIYLGVDLEDSNTWTGEYQAVFYYKLFKKIDKVISAFINGKNGRQMVQVVRQDPTKSYAARVSDYTPELGIDLVGLAALISQYSYAEITAA